MIESDGRRCRMLRFGALRATRKGPDHFPERLHEIHSMLAALIAFWKGKQDVEYDRRGFRSLEK